MMIEAISLDAATSAMPEFSLPDANGLRPLELPIALFSHRSVESTLENPDAEISRKPVNQDSVRRFESAMAAPKEQPFLNADLFIKKPFAEPLKVSAPRDPDIRVTEAAPVSTAGKDTVMAPSVQPSNLGTDPIRVAFDLGRDPVKVAENGENVVEFAQITPKPAVESVAVPAVESPVVKKVGASKPAAREAVVPEPVAPEFVEREIDRRPVSRDDIPGVAEVRTPMENAAPSVVQPRDRVVVNANALRELVRNLGRDPVKIAEKGNNAVEFARIAPKPAVESVAVHAAESPVVKTVIASEHAVSKPVVREAVESEPVAPKPVAPEFVAREVDRKPVSRDEIPVVAEVRVPMENAAQSAVQTGDRIVVNSDALSDQVRNLGRDPIKVVPETGTGFAKIVGTDPLKTDPVKVEPDPVKVVPEMGRGPVNIVEKSEDVVEFVQITPKATVEPTEGHIDNSAASMVVVPGSDEFEPAARKVVVPEPVESEYVAREVDRKHVSRDDVPIVAEVRIPMENAVPSAVQAGDRVAVNSDAPGDLVRNLGRDHIKVVPDVGIESVKVAGLDPVKDLGTDPVKVEPDPVKVVPEMGRDPVNVVEKSEDAVEFVQITPKATVEPTAGHIDNSPASKIVVVAEPVASDLAVRKAVVAEPVASDPAVRKVVVAEPVAPASVEREVSDRKPVSRDDVPVVAEVRIPIENAAPSAVQSGDRVAVNSDTLRKLDRDPVNVAPETGIETVIVAGLGPVKDVGTDPVNVEPDAVKVVPEMGRDPVKIAENGEDAAEFVQITPKATVEPVAGPVDNSPVAKTVVAPGPDVPKPVAREPVAREVAAPEPVASASVAREVDREVADRKSVQRDDAPVVAEVRAPVDSLVAAQSAGIAVAVPEDVAASARTLAIAQAVDKIVEAVSAQIEIRPSLVNGEGEIVIRLKPTVLDGSEIKLAAKDGILSMEITPATPQAEQVVARSVPQLERALAEHIPAFHGFTVAVRSRGEERKDR